ncbi:hypothetical protein HGI30_11120 [Paenibacillus albicereus]|uniref:Uncharacterized protein n=1 Tax=Paenibacillus albicereus TaxID=2726185 RepID=A0A6H2GY42_9BACL|nr:glucosaminidase domain-containing protein [Paenibacillus albicereus]QJC52048.1 hypothetical protein HGI30_11120 [Paenibacillus albicereus]
MNTPHGAAILTPSDIRHIRTFIDDKYPEKPQSEKSELVADAIRRAIFHQLPDFADSIKKELTSRLVRRYVVGQKGFVRGDDIVEACLELDIRDQRIVRPLRSWIERKLDVTVEERELQRVLRLVKPTHARAESMELLGRIAEELDAPAPGTVDPSADERQGAPSWLASMPSMRILTAAIGCVMIMGGMLVYVWSLLHDRPQSAGMAVVSAAELEQPAASPQAAPRSEPAAPEPASAAAAEQAPMMDNELPRSLQYADIDEAALQDFLEGRSSMLAGSRYMEAILDAARHYNIHPLLLFAITGQEQSFVPDDHKRAEQMANNPFNVHYSWQNFNTTIEESSMIAAKTVVNLSKNRPEDRDAIVWINRKYAEDPNWSKGVTSILDMLEEIAA